MQLYRYHSNALLIFVKRRNIEIFVKKKRLWNTDVTPVCCSDSSPPKKVKTDQSNVPPPPSVGSQSSYQYSNPSGPYQSQQQFQGGQYGGQGGYQQGYQQYPPPSDPNYANYQNWQYGQGGPQAYGPYNQWGSYNYYWMITRSFPQNRLRYMLIFVHCTFSSVLFCRFQFRSHWTEKLIV